jgi:hypothetical protein
MAEEVEDDLDEEDEENEYDEEEESYTHRGMRWLFQAAQGEELDDDEDDEEDDELEEQPIEKPSINLITEKLKNQNIQMEDLVKVLLLEHDEYIDMEEECDQQSNTLFGILRIIISNYKPEDESIIGRIA